MSVVAAPRYNKQRLAETLLIAAGGTAVSWVIVSQPLSWFSLLLALAATMLVILWRWPHGALFAVMTASAMPRYTIKLFSLTLKLEHVVTVLTAVTILAVFGWRKMQLHATDFLLLAFVGMNFVSSAIESPDPKVTLTHAVLFALVVLPYWIVRQLASDANRLRRAIQIFLLVGVGEATFGILCWVSNQLTGTELGITYYWGILPGVHGSQWEPNIFGSYVSSFAAMFFFYYLQRDSRRKLYFTACLVAALATLLSLARAAWLGLIVVLFLFSPHRYKRELIGNLGKAGALLAGLLLSVGLVFGLSSLWERASTLDPTTVLEDPTLVHRIVYAQQALEDVQQHLWIGSGTESFQLFVTWDTENGEQRAWVANVFLRSLHDSGIIGLGLFCAFLATTFWQGYQTWKRKPSERASTTLGALLAGAMVLAVAYQFTDATMLAFTWVYLGLLAAATNIHAQVDVPTRALAQPS